MSDVNKTLELVIATAKSNKVSFTSLTYTNAEGEKATHLINLNATYEKAKAKDIATLEKIEDSSLESEILIQAKNELLASLIKPNENLSKGQINAYTHINGALKYHNETKDLYMFGLVAKKKVLSEGVYKETNKRALTIAKDKIKKDYKLKTATYKQFKISRFAKVSLFGETIEFQIED